MTNYKEGERYRIYNPLSDNNGYFLTVVKVINKIIYYLFDGEDEVRFFIKEDQFSTDLIKIA